MSDEPANGAAMAKVVETDEVWRGDWTQTFLGKQFFPLSPRVEDIDIRDIAHALSMQCRFSGHVIRFYSVAEHSIHVASFCPPKWRLWGLLHDAAEAYLVDVPRPIKPFLPQFREIDERITRAVAERFGLEPIFPMPDTVKEIDDRILMDERNANMGAPPIPWNFELPPLGVELRYWSPAEAEQQFLLAFEALQRP